MSKSPWKTLASKIVYQNPWIKIHEDKVIRPDGQEGIYGYLDKPDGVFVLARSRDNSFYFLRQYRYPLKKYIYEIPAGVVDSQNYLDNAKRELYEETGLQGQTWFPLGSFFIGPGHENVCAHAFLVTDLVNEDEISQNHQEGDESIEKVIKLSLKQVQEYMQSGKIECGITLAAWNLYQNSPYFIG